ncbi:MAG: hypothetical protein AAF962_16800 [Actinomycetota bacterium]
MQDGIPPQPGDGPRYQPPQSPPPHSQPPQYQQPGQPPPQYPQPGYQQPGYQQPGYQQPGYQQPGFQPPGQSAPYGTEPPKKKRVPTWLLFLLMGGGLVLVLGACVGYFVFQAVGEINRSNDFAAAWAERDYAELQTLVEPGCGVASSDFEEFIGSSRITDYQFDSVNVVNGDTFTSGTITFDGSDERTIELGWQNDLVCTFEIGPRS